MFQSMPFARGYVAQANKDFRESNSKAHNTSNTLTLNPYIVSPMCQPLHASRLQVSEIQSVSVA